MDNVVKEITIKNKKLVIYQDCNGENNPREWDNLGIMVCFHNRYTLGDKVNISSDDFSDWSELKDFIMKEYNTIAILPIFMIDHSGISISVRDFNDGWQEIPTKKKSFSDVYASRCD